MKKEILKSKLMKLFWIFLIGSVVGCLVETVVCIVQKGHFEFRQGLLYGPFIPVYGIGAVVYELLLFKVKDLKKAFFLSMILGGCVEYFCSWIQEVWFGTVSWDYSNLWFNINGRTSLLHCLYWGIGGMLFVKWLVPFFDKLGVYSMEHMKFQYLTMFLVTFLSVNIAVSCLAAERQKERIQNKVAEDKIDTFLDKHYPDSVMDIVFSNKQLKQGGNRYEMPAMWE